MQNSREQTRRKADRSHEAQFKRIILYICVSMFIIGASFGYYWAMAEVANATKQMRAR